MIQMIRPSSRLRGVAFAVTVLLGLLASPRPVLAQLTPIRLLYPPIVDVLPAYVAKDRGIFEKHGLDVTMTVAQNLPVTVAALVAGSADIGFSVALTTIQAKEAGIDQVIVAGAVEFPVPAGYAGILARTGSGIAKPQDLRGKKVAVAGLMGFHHLVAIDWLQKNGVDPTSVTFVEVPFAQQADVLKSGQIDAVVTVNPIYGRIINAKTGYFFADYLAVIPPRTASDFYVAMRAWANENRAAVAAFRASLAEAAELIKTDEKGARSILQRWTKLPDAVVEQSIIPPFTISVEGDQLAFWLEAGEVAESREGGFSGLGVFPRWTVSGGRPDFRPLKSRSNP